jgi:hypothetical protein
VVGFEVVKVTVCLWFFRSKNGVKMQTDRFFLINGGDYRRIKENERNSLIYS